MRDIVIQFLILCLVSQFGHLGYSKVVGEINIKSNKYKVTKVLTLSEVISSFQFIDKRNLITLSRNTGLIYVHNLSDTTKRRIAHNLNVYMEGQGGLLDIQLHPNFSDNNIVFISYSKKNGNKQTTALVKAELSGDQLINYEEYFSAFPVVNSKSHFGSRIQIKDSKYIFLSIGDRGTKELAQKLDNHIGKIIRLNLDGTTPLDNPFVNKDKARPEIWTYGHRNPQGLFYDKLTGLLYSNEHGPRGGDEINVITKGGNYGWPIASYGRDYRTGEKIGDEVVEGTLQPLKYYIPSIAPGSLVVYNHDQLPDFKGKFISSALALRHLNLVSVNSPNLCEDRPLLTFNYRIRALTIGLDNNLYFSVDNVGIFRVEKVLQDEV